MKEPSPEKAVSLSVSPETLQAYAGEHEVIPPFGEVVAIARPPGEAP